MTVGPLLLLISLSFILFGNKPQPFTPIIAGPAFSFGGVVISQVTVATVVMAVVDRDRRARRAPPHARRHAAARALRASDHGRAARHPLPSALDRRVVRHRV